MPEQLEPNKIFADYLEKDEVLEYATKSEMSLDSTVLYIFQCSLIGFIFVFFLFINAIIFWGTSPIVILKLLPWGIIPLLAFICYKNSQWLYTPRFYGITNKRCIVLTETKLGKYIDTRIEGDIKIEGIQNIYLKNSGKKLATVTFVNLLKELSFSDILDADVVIDIVKGKLNI